MKNKNAQVHPFLKWVGGKAQLVKTLLQYVPDKINTYFEPFLGGGALFYELYAQRLFNKAVISDSNTNLMDAYFGVRDYTDTVIALLKTYIYEEKFFYKMRAINPATLTIAERAARFIYLNRTCFNGLYRESSKGIFNAPFGRYTNPLICDEENLHKVKRALSAASVKCQDFSDILKKVKTGDFVYFDPPYYPISKTSSFTRYNRLDFDEEAQLKLRDLFAQLSDTGVAAMVSNSNTPFIRKIYKDFNIKKVRANRSVNSKGNKRGKITELIITNY